MIIFRQCDQECFCFLIISFNQYCGSHCVRYRCRLSLPRVWDSMLLFIALSVYCSSVADTAIHFIEGIFSENMQKQNGHTSGEKSNVVLSHKYLHTCDHELFFFFFRYINIRKYPKNHSLIRISKRTGKWNRPINWWNIYKWWEARKKAPKKLLIRQ